MSNTDKNAGNEHITNVPGIHGITASPTEDSTIAVTGLQDQKHEAVVAMLFKKDIETKPIVEFVHPRSGKVSPDIDVSAYRKQIAHFLQETANLGVYVADLSSEQQKSLLGQLPIFETKDAEHRYGTALAILESLTAKIPDRIPMVMIELKKIIVVFNEIKNLQDTIRRMEKETAAGARWFHRFGFGNPPELPEEIHDLRERLGTMEKEHGRLTALNLNIDRLGGEIYSIGNYEADYLQRMLRELASGGHMQYMTRAGGLLDKLHAVGVSKQGARNKELYEEFMRIRYEVQ